MTTNNPPIAAWAPGAALAKLAARHNNSSCVLTDGPAEFNDVALIRLSDYEAMQAELSTMHQRFAELAANFAVCAKERMKFQLESEPLQSECEKLRAAIRRLCNIYVVDDYYDGQLREERLEAAVNRAINAVMETPDAP